MICNVHNNKERPLQIVYKEVLYIMKWLRNEFKQLEKRTRVLIYTPDNDDEVMKYRVIDSDLLPRVKDATHYCILYPPKEVL
jgi:hypothetical protein